MVGVLSSPVPIIVQFLILKTPDLIPSADSMPSMYEPLILYVAYPAEYIPLPVDVIFDVFVMLMIGELFSC